MSDGIFNRSLLPHTPYHSGLQAGKAMARMQAIETFKCYLATLHPDSTEEERNGNLQKDAIGEIVTERPVLFPFRTTPISLYYNRVYIK